ncbi:MAG: SHOCT domain-containing protein [Euryarchaeota archaeon]|nr:SHOCT domain-containing protein [Euryarchaeota archaeon]
MEDIATSYGGMFYISSYYIPEQNKEVVYWEDAIENCRELHMRDTLGGGLWTDFDDYWEDISWRQDYVDEYKSNVGTAQEVQKSLPFGILIGAVIMFVGFIVNKDIFLDKIFKDKKEIEKISKTSNDAINILNLRYAKGEITKEQFEQMKKDLEN